MALPDVGRGTTGALFGFRPRSISREVSTSKFENGQIRRSDTIFLIVVGLVALGASAGMFCLGKMQDQPVAAKSDDEDRPRIPLPAGPRKYP